MREISDRSPAPGASRSSGSDPPPIIEPSELKRRSSNPPSDDESDESLLPSFPPDAIVPGAASSDEMAIAPVVTHDIIAPWPIVEVVPVPRPAARLVNAETLEPQYESPFAAATITRRGVQEAPARSERPVPLPAAPPEPVETSGPKKRSGWLLFLTFAVLATAVGAALRASGGSEEGGSRAAIPTATTTPTPTTTTTQTASDEIPPGAEVPAGYGLISVEAPAGAHVRVDGAMVGVGPMTSSVAAPGYHEVRVEQGGHELKSVVEVRAGKTTHAGSTLLP
jgi:hypothetical protein